MIVLDRMLAPTVMTYMVKVVDGAYKRREVFEVNTVVEKSK